MMTMFKPVEQTREHRVRELYAQYCEAHQAKVAQYAPTRLSWEETRQVEKAIVEGRLKPVTRSSKIMQNGTRLDRSGVYVIDGITYDFCEYCENRGSLPLAKCDRYDSLESFYNFSYPLPRYMWHE
jgi:hypothetical protein